MGLHGKTALVTGSTSGIGWGIAKRLAAAGCDLVLNGFGADEEIVTLQQEIQALGSSAVYIAADVSKAADVEAMFDQVEARGGLDILVNNAGIQYISEIEELDPENWERVIATNLTSAFLATRLALPMMKRKGWGRIINVASAHGLVASAGKGPYVASKHGLIGLTKVTALEAAPFGITANAVCPGWTRTPLAEKQVSDRAGESGRSFEEEATVVIGEKQAMAKFTDPDQIGGVVTFLCSEDAGTMTGTPVSVDGGWTAQ